MQLSAFVTIKLEGIQRVTVPSGCRFEGREITLSPTDEIHFDGGGFFSVPVDAARDVELKNLGLTPPFIMLRAETRVLACPRST